MEKKRRSSIPKKPALPIEEKKKFIEENMTLLKQADDLSDEIRQIEPNLQIKSRISSLKQVYVPESEHVDQEALPQTDSVPSQMLKRLAHHMGLCSLPDGHHDREIEDARAEELTLQIISSITGLQEIRSLFPAKEREIQQLKSQSSALNKRFNELKQHCSYLEGMQVKVSEMTKINEHQQKSIDELQAQLSDLEQKSDVQHETIIQYYNILSKVAKQLGLNEDLADPSSQLLIVESLERKLLASHDAEEALFSTQLELQHVRDQLYLIAKEKKIGQDLNSEAIECDTAASELIRSLRGRGLVMQPLVDGDRARDLQTRFRVAVLAVVAANRIMSCKSGASRRRDVHAAVSEEEHSGLQQVIKNQQQIIAELKSQIITWETTLAFERRVMQDYESLKERFLRMAQLNKEQSLRLQRIPELEHQLVMRGQALEDLRKLLRDSGRPLQELKDELAAVNQRYQAALLAKQEAEVRASREHQSCQILQTENNMLKSRLGRMSVTMPLSSRPSFVSQASMSGIYQTDVYDRMQLRATQSFAQATASMTNLEARLMKAPMSVNSNHEIEKDS